MKRSSGGVAAALGVVAALAVAPVATAATGTNSSQLRQAVTAAGIQEHLQAFQNIANMNGGHRASGSPGYDASLAYVKSKLEDTGYFNVRVQPFSFDLFTETAPAEFQRISHDARTYVSGTDFLTMEYSGSGDVTGAVVPTNDIVIPPGSSANTSTAGCESSDFVPASSTDLQVALIQRGTCTFAQKAQNAEAAGYDAAIIFNEGQAGRTDVLNGTLGGSVGIPVIGTTFAVGEELYNQFQSGQNPVVRVFTATKVETKETANLIADTKTGRTDRVVVVGSHLDSVPEGPGINDNGSGSGQDIEIALQMAELNIKPRNQVRFAFWGAEESGLIGSQYYVDQLSSKSLKNIAVNLNFDMVGSTNFVRFVYDGSSGSTGSSVVEDVFGDYFRSRDLAYEPTAFDGRSDYDAFISVGIPAGGLFTGAEGVKSPEEAAIYGGTAGIAYDPCYHEACDDIDNVSNTALSQMSDAAAHATLTFAQTTSAVEGTDKGKAVGHGDYQGSSLRR